MKDGFERVVDDYVRDHQHNAEREQRWFTIQPTLRAAVGLAALAKSPNGTRLSHQRRIPARVLDTSREKLLRRLPELNRARSFEALYDIVSSAIRSIHGIGELAVYDTALRIGAYRRLEPRRVFLHAGARAGARRLGLNVTGGHLEMSELPKEFRVLKASEVEDVLCIYKHRFSSGMATNNAFQRTRSRCALVRG